MSPDNQNMTVFAAYSKEREAIPTDTLAKRWGIGKKAAANTLNVTTQKGVRKAQHPVQKRFNTSMPHLRYKRLHDQFYSDTAFFKAKSIRGFTCAQITTNGKGFSRFWAMVSKADANDGLLDFIQNVGIPENLLVDGSKEQGGVRDGRGGQNTAWRQTLRTYHIAQRTTEPYSPWQNRAEGEVREIKRGIKKLTMQAQSPKRLWCFCGEVVVAQRRLTASNIPSLRGRTPHEHVTGETPNITAHAQFEWYQWVYFLGTDGKQSLARWLGPAEGIGGEDCHWLLTETCHPIAKSTVWTVPDEDMINPEKKLVRDAFDAKVKSRIGEEDSNEVYDAQLPDYGDLFDDDDFIEDPMEPEAAMPEADDFTPDSYDNYLTAEVLLPRDGQLHSGTVRKRVTDADGNPVGKAHSNPLLDTRSYEVEFPDGSTDVYAANLIAENIYSQVDDEGRQFSIMQEITDYQKGDTAIGKADGFWIDKSGRRRPKMTTRGWEFLVSWKDGSASWAPLKDLKESNPVEVAEYAVANKISDEPAFAWWVGHVIRKKKRIISKVKSKYWKRTHKYGIRVPKSVEEALRIDGQNGNTYWADAIAKEMRNVRVAFEFNEEDTIPIAHKEIRCHMVFDIKITLDRKAQFVANGNETEPPKDMTFSSVVSRDSVRLFFLLAALNDVEVLSADIQNAYLSAETKEKLWYRAGLEFGSDKGRPAKIVRALYGLKSSGARFRDHLAGTLRQLGFISCKADPDVWLRPAVKTDGTKYYEYVLCYVDDILCQSQRPDLVMKSVSGTYTLKEGSVKEPDLYLGAQVKKWYIQGSEDPEKPRWAMSSEVYTKRAIVEVERELKEAGKQLQKKASTPLTSGYRPELDASPELDADRQNYYQGLIGVLRWICELGRLDILQPVSLLSRYLVSARQGHLEQVFHIFAYMKSHERSTLVFDDTEPDFLGSEFHDCDWSKFYPGAKEAIPTDMPEPRGRPVVTSCFVDADHAGCRVTRRLHTGVLIFVNRAPILWYSKRQNTVESSTFGSEFIALKTAIEMIEGLRYKLRMMGVEIEGSTSVFCDNDSVVKNATNPESTLKKKHNAIAYHRAREAIAAQTVRLAKEDGDTNLADILTKLLGAPRLKALISRILW